MSDACADLVKKALAATARLPLQAARAITQRLVNNDGETAMPDTNHTIRVCEHFAALKNAIMAEQHVLELDIRIVSARVQALLSGAQGETASAAARIVIIGAEHELP